LLGKNNECTNYIHGAALGGSPISALNIGRFINKKEFNPIFVFEK
jgi:hypothetical protein